MPKVITLQNNFTTGEVSPQIQARVDLGKYEGACRKILNGIVMAQGGVTKRPGTRYVATALDDGILFPFAYSQTQTYALLFTDKKVRFFSQGGAVTVGENGPVYEIESPYALADLPLLKFAQSADVMYLVHPKYPPKKLMRFDHTDWKFEDVQFVPGIASPDGVAVNVTGMTDSTGTYLATTTEYKVAAVSMDGEESLPSEAVAAATLSTWPQGARVNIFWDPVPGAVRYEVYKNVHGWFEWVGSTEVASFLDDNIEPDGSMCPKEARDPFHAPATPTVTVSGAEVYQVRVSAVNSAGAESIASSVASGSTVKVFPVKDAELYYVYTRESDSDNWKYRILTAGSSVMTIDVNNGNGNEVAAVYEKTGNTSTVDGGTVYEWKLTRSYSGSHSEKAYTDTGTPNTESVLYWIRWKSDGRADKVREMSEKIITVHDPQDLQLVILGSTIPTQPGVPLDKPDSYPGAVGIFQQRLMFGRTKRNPQTVWMSETGSFNSMAVSHPLRNDSAITVTVDSRQMNEVRHFVALNDCFVLTNAAEFRMTEKDGAITPGTIGFRPQSFWGASEVPPLTIGTTILLLDGSGRTVRDVHYNLQEDGYAGDDRSVLATHLLRKPIIDWAYQQNPFSTVYAINSDGKLLTFTYMREQEVWAWAQHESSGAMFRSVCCVREDGKDRVYFLVKRGLNLVEAAQKKVDIAQEWVSDAQARETEMTDLVARLQVREADGEDVEGELEAANAELAAATASLENANGALTAASSELTTAESRVAYFVEEQVLRDYGDEPQDACYVDCSVSGTTGSAVGHTTIPGLSHLEGNVVSALVDGTVVTGCTVTNGEITIPAPAETKITVGLPYTMEVETVDPSINGQNGSQYGSRKVVGPVLVDVLETGDMQVGTDVNHLEEIKVPIEWGPPTHLYTGVLKTSVPGFARNGASVVVRSNTPLPATVLAVKAEVSIG